METRLASATSEVVTVAASPYPGSQFPVWQRDAETKGVLRILPSLEGEGGCGAAVAVDSEKEF